MATISAGLMLFRHSQHGLEVLLVHPGGPFFRGKDLGVWTIPKGLPEPGEAWPLAAIREFQEETGLTLDVSAASALIELGSVRQKGGKVVHAWALEGNIPDGFVPCSNTFELEWPPRSGRKQAFPEIDRWEFFTLSQAAAKLNPAQLPFLDRLRETRAG